jgi:hypothetical protein
VKVLNWGLPLSAVLIVVLAVIFGRSSTAPTTAAPIPSAEVIAAAADDLDGDGIADARDPDPYSANSESGAQQPSPSTQSTARSSRPAAKPRKATATLAACDANIRVKKPQTTCGFAQNVFYGYWLNEYEPGVFADSPGIPAYSPAAGAMLTVTCSGASKIVCRGGDGGYVTFPNAAISGYTLSNAHDYAATHELGDVPPPDGSADQRDPAPSDPGGGGDCDPNYEGQCLDPNAYDYDCEGGSGDGPEYAGTVDVVGDDHFDLDRDGNGIGCD